MRTVPAALALVCTLAACSKDDDSASPKGTPAADLTGDWSGALTGTLSNSDGGDPACTGNVYATVDAEGALSGTGTCQGVAVEEGSVFIVSFTGSTNDGAPSVALVFDGDAWSDATLTGSGAAGRIELGGSSTYTPANREPVDATLTLVLER